MSDVNQTAHNFGYQAVVPRHLGQPVYTVTNKGNKQSLEPVARAIAFEYDHPTFGKIGVEEHPTGLTEAELEGQPAYLESLCNDLQPSLVTLDDGSRALLVVDPTRTTDIEWLPRPGFMIHILGPTATFSRDDAVAAANQV